MILTAGEIQRIHAFFGQADEIVERRRVIYRAALDLAGRAAESGSPADLVSVAVLDNPPVRAHLGEVLGGSAAYDPRRLRPWDDYVVLIPADVPGSVVRVAGTKEAPRAFAGALRKVGAGLGVADFDLDANAVVLPGSERFSSAARILVGGLELAVARAPELAGDLLPHVAVFALLRADRAARLGSASVRDFPGLVLLPEPRTELEAAEALVHEGAHQKFFDLAMTRFVFTPYSHADFLPPWSSSDAQAWPFEQCVAAFHAYSCLAAFAGTVDDIEWHAHSLLPMAAERAEALGDWLHANSDFFGSDGRRLVGELSGRQLGSPATSADGPKMVGRRGDSPDLRTTRQCGDWTLLMQWDKPVHMMWVPTKHLFDGRIGVDAPASLG